MAGGPTAARMGTGSGRSREELAGIRTWARAHVHQVADLGTVPKWIQEAYDAARETRHGRPADRGHMGSRSHVR
ncbi:hypothetical protein [Streptomyces sp. NPDC088180]|uniref:Lsr2 family DNA-binding protein n=1 Tax=Streptomyces sp. NPDC088180 TaxID=3365837 RepID=UPI00381418B2